MKDKSEIKKDTNTKLLLILQEIEDNKENKYTLEYDKFVFDYDESEEGGSVLS